MIVLFLLACLQIYCSVSTSEIQSFLARPEVLHSEAYTFLKSDINNIYEKMVFGLR